MSEDQRLKKCVQGLKLCSEVKPCPMHAEYKLIKPQLIKMFEMKTIQDLADDIDNGDVFISNKNQ